MNQIGQPIVAEAAWKGPEIDWTTNGLHVLTPAQVAEIDAALATSCPWAKSTSPTSRRRPFRWRASAN